MSCIMSLIWRNCIHLIWIVRFKGHNTSQLSHWAWKVVSPLFKCGCNLKLFDHLDHDRRAQEGSMCPYRSFTKENHQNHKRHFILMKWSIVHYVPQCHSTQYWPYPILVWDQSYPSKHADLNLRAKGIYMWPFHL